MGGITEDKTYKLRNHVHRWEGMNKVEQSVRSRAPAAGEHLLKKDQSLIIRGGGLRGERELW